jgi:NACHT domain
LERRAVEALAGRCAEIERLEAFALADEPVVMHIQGIPGIGKTHLLNTLAARVGEKSVFVVRIDARWCEPSPAALCRAICRECGASESEDAAVVASILSDRAQRTLLVLDSYESFRLLDSWLRQVFLASLGDTVRTILSSREPPKPAWRIGPAWRGLFDSILLETFPNEVASSI